MLNYTIEFTAKKVPELNLKLEISGIKVRCMKP